MPRPKCFAEDTDEPIVMQLGTVREPFDLTGKAPKILLRDVATNTRIDAGSTIVQDPPTAGRVQRALLEAERVVGKRYIVECVVDPDGGRTFPDANQQPLEIEIVARRTTPVP